MSGPTFVNQTALPFMKFVFLSSASEMGIWVGNNNVCSSIIEIEPSQLSANPTLTVC